jgi:hypothetical protein
MKPPGPGMRGYKGELPYGMSINWITALKSRMAL